MKIDRILRIVSIFWKGGRVIWLDGDGASDVLATIWNTKTIEA